QQSLADRLGEREEKVVQVRRLSFQPGCGNVSCASAESLGSTTVGLRFRFCSAVPLILTFWPLASNSIGPPTITCSSILVLRSASISASGLVDCALSQACAAISSASKVKPASMSIWTPGNFAMSCFSSTFVMFGLRLSHGWIDSVYSLYLPMLLMKSCSYMPGVPGLMVIGSQRCFTISCTISLASLRRQIGISISALLALALATSTDRSLAAAS